MNQLNPNSHLTAKERDAPSLPVRMLHERRLMQGSVLDYGCSPGPKLELLAETAMATPSAKATR